MGTRAVFTFKSEGESFSVYKHWDGYPEWSARCIVKAQALAWLAANPNKTPKFRERVAREKHSRVRNYSRNTYNGA